MKLFRIMSKDKLKSALMRSIILEYQNDKVLGAMSWGHDAPKSMYIARKNRMRLAELYSRKYEPVSKLLFQKKLPTLSVRPEPADKALSKDERQQYREV